MIKYTSEQVKDLRNRGYSGLADKLERENFIYPELTLVVSDLPPVIKIPFSIPKPLKVIEEAFEKKFSWERGAFSILLFTDSDNVSQLYLDPPTDLSYQDIQKLFEENGEFFDSLSS